MKKLISISVVLLLVLTSVFAFSVSAAEEDTIIHNLLPAENDVNGKVTATDCDLTYNEDGSVTFTITGAAPVVTVVFAEGSTVYAGDSFNVKEGEGYVVFDYASADGASLNGTGGTVAHYTRKDKAANGALADLFLASMESSDYATYSKASGEGYGIWALGEYIVKGKGDAGTFDDGMHRIDNVTYALAGEVGSSLTIYRFYVGSADAVEGLGAVRPAAKPEALDGKYDIFASLDGKWVINAHTLDSGETATPVVTYADGVATLTGSVAGSWPSVTATLETPVLLGEGAYFVYDFSFVNGSTSILFNGTQVQSLFEGASVDPGSGDIYGADYKGAVSYDDLAGLLGTNEDGLVEITSIQLYTVNTAELTYNTFEFDSAYVPTETPDDTSDEVSEPADDSSEPADDSSAPAADDESEPAADESDASVPTGDEKTKNPATGVIIGIVVGVVAIVVVVVIVVKKKK